MSIAQSDATAERLEREIVDLGHDAARRARMAEAARGGASARVLIVAPPGVGKTRLLEAVAAELAEGGWHIVRGRATAEGSAFDTIATTVWPASVRAVATARPVSPVAPVMTIVFDWAVLIPSLLWSSPAARAAEALARRCRSAAPR